MTKVKTTKRALWMSAVSLLLCFVMLLGATFAWFTDSVTSENNIIKSGNLDIELEYWNGEAWIDVAGASEILTNELWEPGVTEVAYLRVANAGSLALKYQLGINIVSETEGVNAAGEAFKLSDYIQFGVVENVNGETGAYDDRAAAVGDVSEAKKISEGYTKASSMASGEELYVALVVYMPETVGNEANHNGTDIPEIELGINVMATQYALEEDSFDSTYDEGAQWPDNFVSGSTVSVPITLNRDGTLAERTVMQDAEGRVTTVIPEGVKFDQGTTSAQLTVDIIEESSANINLEENEQRRSYDVHIAGVAPDNTKAIEIEIAEFLPIGLNLGNYALYHVEDGETVAMTLLADGEAPAHNTFAYDPATGNVTLYLASFSEVAFVVGDAKWEGEYDYSWYNTSSDTYYISNADQLAAFSAIVGGMNGQTQYSFVNKTVQLISNIDLGDAEDANESLLFHPIGYYYNGNDSSPYSTVYSFEGTFDGNGHKISNFYQNTWEIKGDYDGNYYKDAMGLFGYVVNGTVKNLTVDHFSSDGEFTPTGVIAAYAVNSTFENIAITNCNPRVYNTGNGGIVGIGGNSDDPDTYKLTFSNITIDNTNTITSLWGSWDTACGGLIGMFRGAGHVKMTNCHVGAQIDVYNDVCGNYQYYWYRYSGILIGTNKNMYTDDQGYTVPETDKFEATGCTVHFGDWNNYYYCELVANTLASYTHDHQFSRLTEIASLDEIKSGDTWTKTGNFLLINGDTKTCYHIVKDANGNLVEHKHEDAGEETVNGETVLKEDKQIVYLPFNQLFTGYGWGVKHIPIYNDKNQNPFKGVTILDRTQADSVEKFEGRRFNSVTQNGILIEEGILASPISGRQYKLSHIFNYLEDAGVPVITGALTVTVTNLDENGNVTATLTRDAQNWEDCVLVFSGKGRIRLTIQDYYYCTPTSVEIQVKEYPAGSKVRNFTYDGFGNGEEHHFSGVGDHITSGKHGTYECDFGYGPEVLDYAHKFDSKGKIVFTAPADGSYTIAYASQNANAGIRYRVKNNANSEYGEYKTLDIIRDTYELHVAKLEMEAGKTYEFTRLNKECGVYYVGYVPHTSIPDNHAHIFYEDSTADCETGGKMTEMCMICGLTNTHDNVPELGHDWVNEPGYPETCEDTGKNPGVYCARCNKIESGCDSTPAHGHTYVNGFCHCKDEACHRPEQINNIIAGVDFTKGSSNDYSDFGTNSFFKPNGNCNMSNDNKYLIMKAYTHLGDINSEGDATVYHHSYIEFTVAQDVTFYVRVASTDRTNTSKFVLEDTAGNQIKAVFHDDENTSPVVEVTGVSGHTLIYTLEAGTYRFYCTSTERVGRVMNMVVSTDVVTVK